MRLTVAIVGATGFIGKATSAALLARGHEVTPISAPRLHTTERTWAGLNARIAVTQVDTQLRAALSGCDVLINAAGISDSGSNGDNLFGANALLPAVLQKAAALAKVARYIHISSAGVQTAQQQLDESSRHSPISPYTSSKALGEKLLNLDGITTIYRPTSVHGESRHLSHSLSRVARSKLASVASPGTQPTPQVLVENVADAIGFLIEDRSELPRIVLQPNESLTTFSLLELLGAKEPRIMPDQLTRSILKISRLAPQHARIAANRRRLEMLWYGQRQASSWLEHAGWTPPVGPSGWIDLATRLRQHSDLEGRGR